MRRQAQSWQRLEPDLPRSRRATARGRAIGQELDDVGRVPYGALVWTPPAEYGVVSYLGVRVRQDAPAEAQMAVRPILTLENPMLRQKAKRVKRVDKALDPLIQDMVDSMHAAPGIGLAAPQIGIPLRLMIIEIEGEMTTLVNPEIVKAQGEWEPEEGCLSIPGYVANVKRAWAVTVKAKNRQGRDVRLKGEGLFGQALQHEVDHLDGILYIDRLESMDLLRPADPERRRRRAAEAREPEYVG